MENNALCIPMHLDALFVAEKTICAEARLNFSRLPYFDGFLDRNADVAYLGEEIQSVPLSAWGISATTGHPSSLDFTSSSDPQCGESDAVANCSSSAESGIRFFVSRVH